MFLFKQLSAGSTDGRITALGIMQSADKVLSLSCTCSPVSIVFNVGAVQLQLLQLLIA